MNDFEFNIKLEDLNIGDYIVMVSLTNEYRNDRDVKIYRYCGKNTYKLVSYSLTIHGDLKNIDVKSCVDGLNFVLNNGTTMLFDEYCYAKIINQSIIQDKIKKLSIDLDNEYKKKNEELYTVFEKEYKNINREEKLKRILEK